MRQLIDLLNAHERIAGAVMVAIAALLFCLAARRSIAAERRHRAIFGRAVPRDYDDWSGQ